MAAPPCFGCWACAGCSSIAMASAVAGSTAYSSTRIARSSLDSTFPSFRDEGGHFLGYGPPGQRGFVRRGCSGCVLKLCPPQEADPGLGLPSFYPKCPGQCAPATVSCIIVSASSMVKVLGFWTGGKSL